MTWLGQKEIKSRSKRRERALFWAEHYKRELNAPGVLVFTSRRDWLIYGPWGIGKTVADLADCYGQAWPGDESGFLFRRNPAIWVNVEKPDSDAGFQDVVQHELFHAIYGLEDSLIFEKAQNISWLHPRTGRNLDRLARAALRMVKVHPPSDWSEDEVAEFDERWAQRYEARLDRQTELTSLSLGTRAG